jgi:hypothetical protein
VKRKNKMKRSNSTSMPCSLKWAIAIDRASLRIDGKIFFGMIPIMRTQDPTDFLLISSMMRGLCPEPFAGVGYK